MSYRFPLYLLFQHLSYRFQSDSEAKVASLESLSPRSQGLGECSTLCLHYQSRSSIQVERHPSEISSHFTGQVCLHIASHMFFIITVNLARYALSELQALRAGSHDANGSAQSTSTLRPVSSTGWKRMYLFFDILLFLLISTFFIFALLVVLWS